MIPVAYPYVRGTISAAATPTLLGIQDSACRLLTPTLADFPPGNFLHNYVQNHWPAVHGFTHRERRIQLPSFDESTYDLKPFGWRPVTRQFAVFRRTSCDSHAVSEQCILSEAAVLRLFVESFKRSSCVGAYMPKFSKPSDMRDCDIDLVHKLTHV
jgi:hypothetical protein